MIVYAIQRLSAVADGIGIGKHETIHHRDEALVLGVLEKATNDTHAQAYGALSPARCPKAILVDSRPGIREGGIARKHEVDNREVLPRSKDDPGHGVETGDKSGVALHALPLWYCTIHTVNR